MEQDDADADDRLRRRIEVTRIQNWKYKNSMPHLLRSEPNLFWEDVKTVVFPQRLALQKVLDNVGDRRYYTPGNYETICKALEAKVQEDPTGGNIVTRMEEGFDGENGIFEDRVVAPCPPNRFFEWPRSPKEIVESDILSRWPDSKNLGPYFARDDSCQPQVVTAWNTWRELDQQRKDDLTADYKKQCDQASETIKDHYVDICRREDMDPATVASILLDIFLTVPPDSKLRLRHRPDDFDTDAFVVRMQETMEEECAEFERLSELHEDTFNADSVQRYKDLIGRLGYGGECNLDTIRWQFMEDVFARDDVPSPRAIEEHRDELLERCRFEWLRGHPEPAQDASYHTYEDWRNTKYGNRVIDEIANKYDAEVQSHRQELIDLAANFRKHVLIREHAMIALIPLLPSLPVRMARKLVYALFMNDSFAFKNYSRFGVALVNKVAYPEDPNSHLPVASSLDVLYDLESFQRLSKGAASFVEMRNGHDFDRLFGLGIPSNVTQAMIDFFLDKALLSGHDESESNHNRLKVLPYLRRVATECPSQARLVHDALATAIEQTMESSKFDWRVLVGDEAGRLRNLKFQDFGRYRGVDGDLLNRQEMCEVVEACIDTCALPAVKVIRKLFRTGPNYINRHFASYGDGGLVSILALLGVENAIRRSDYRRTEGNVTRITLTSEGGQMTSSGPYNFSGQAKCMARNMAASDRTGDVSERCTYCGATGGRLYTCTGCRSVKYCGRDCQKRDRKKHRPRCVSRSSSGI